jgi:hypothetical protein
MNACALAFEAPSTLPTICDQLSPIANTNGIPGATYGTLPNVCYIDPAASELLR